MHLKRRSSMKGNRRLLSLLLAFAFFFSVAAGIGVNVVPAAELEGKITLESWLEPAKGTYEVGESVQYWVWVTNSGQNTMFYYQLDDPKFKFTQRYDTTPDDLITPGLRMLFLVEYTFTKEDVGEFVNVFTAEAHGIVAKDVKTFKVVDPNAQPDKPIKSGRPSWSGGPGKPPGKPGTPGKPPKRP